MSDEREPDDPYVLEATVDCIGPLAVRTGESVVVLADEGIVQVIRTVPLNAGAILGMLADGQLRVIGDPTQDAVSALLSSLSPPLPPDGTLPFSGQRWSA